MILTYPSKQEAEALFRDVCGIECLDGWNFLGVNGAVVMIRGNEIHVAARPDDRGRFVSRRAIRVVLGSLLQIHGVLKTYIRKSNAKGVDFCERLGFVRVGESADMFECELKELRHAV